jgi:HlyD family secretion protein
VEQMPVVEHQHSEEIYDIITVPPVWIVRWGITLFFLIMVIILSLSAFIKYPDIVKTQLKINSPDSPKPVVAKVSGKLVKLCVSDNKPVRKGQILAYIESTGDHDKILQLLIILKRLQGHFGKGLPIDERLSKTNYDGLGELQTSYQAFFQAYLTYVSSVKNGLYLKQKRYLENDLLNLNKQEVQLKVQKNIQKRDFDIAEDDYAMHKRLFDQRVETTTEFRQAESKYISKKTPLIQTDAALITASGNYSTKQKEILELDNQINEGQDKFSQALNSLISQIEDWKSKFVLISTQDGKLTYAGIIQENQNLVPNEDVFYISPGNESFFGEMAIPQNSMGKVIEGQEVLIKLRSYPYEEYGMLRGKIKYIAEVPYKDSVFLSKVVFGIKNSSDMKKPIHLKIGMMADAEIVTQDATILERLSRNLVKIIK